MKKTKIQLPQKINNKEAKKLILVTGRGGL
jgi:hypothetical protein